MNSKTRSFLSQTRIALCGTLLLALAACGRDDAANKPKPPMMVSAETAQLADYVPRLTVLGTVTPLQSVAVRSRVDGQITAVLFKEGSNVRAGQPLFRLDDRAQRASVAQARAALASANAAAVQAEADYKRAQALVKSGFISGATIDQKRAAAESARAGIGGARGALSAAETGLSYLSINAPVSGRTGEIGFKLGATVKANDTAPLVTINQLSPITVRFAVPPDRIQALRDRYAAGAVAVSAHGRGTAGTEEGQTGGVVANGKLVFLDNNVDPLNGSIAAKAEFVNANDELWPGALVELDVPLALPTRLIRLPESAIQNGQDFSYVWTIGADSKAVLTKVTIAGRNDGYAYIASGLQPGAQVVTDALAKLKAGGKVKTRAGKQTGGKPGEGKSGDAKQQRPA
ncbi:efflux RND transporter periplasmic adaptor subunit [Polymorphobacter arshaanensis]|uniref:Efflux RND transporter periplasmic adaptor subunit n=1 Tax=Glacieibacterium arshaanense TaxID=2511025 RepID=A0A4Y9EMX9_9SPHN|nr:efflux RND transporter periplasmic adaptor subunit [Polymorphobacter arshaanensis]TFU03060.1 efflux RND transporter periplasmic adaptor subunit [Polymorphobacter arshaanensis]